ncbi:MAG: class I SAM-dependent methyltransferase [Bacteroidetes bacterium]|nr:MAG: class I SAM-dependent methyltransferase [Bacteroidota bacterium]
MSSSDPASRFSHRVDAYLRYRPGYPPELIHWLETLPGLAPPATIADIGAGTGLLSAPLLAVGYDVLAVEPNPEMARAAREWLNQDKHFCLNEGRAEATGLPDACCAAVVAGQAFHWFEPTESRREFRRILRPGGHIVLIWNERRTDSPFLTDYEAFLQAYSTDYARIDHRQVDHRILEPFFAPSSYERLTFTNEQELDQEGLWGRYQSCSYALPEGHPRFAEAHAALDALYATHRHGGLVRIDYETIVYHGQV